MRVSVQLPLVPTALAAARAPHAGHQGAVQERAALRDHHCQGGGGDCAAQVRGRAAAALSALRQQGPGLVGRLALARELIRPLPACHVDGI